MEDSAPRPPLSPAALAARRANLAKAWQANRTRPYRSTERRRAASQANMQKAIAARRSPEGNARARLNALRHGLFAQRLEDSVRRLGEDPEELTRHRLLFLHAFVPADEAEGQIVARLADLTWRRLRLFRAQADWETRRLHALLEAAEATEALSAPDTERRAWALVRMLNDWDALVSENGKIESAIEQQLRKLLRLRSGGTIRFRGLTPRREEPESENEEFLDWMNRLFVASQRLRELKTGDL